MKIGILSINAYTTVLNYASPLHSYAFQQFLDQNGIDNVIVDYRPQWWNEFFDQRVYDPYQYYLDHPLEDDEAQKQMLDKWERLRELRPQRADRINRFVREHYRMTEGAYDQAALESSDPECDIYICATDVIWKYEPLYGFDRGFFLNGPVMEGKGKIAYAASKGPSDYTPEQEEIFFRMIRPFHYVSCREKSLLELVKKERPASLVLDPVFLHEASFYEEICRKPEEEHYVLVYTVMQRSRSLIRKACEFAERHGLQVIDVSDDANILYGRKKYPRKNRYDAGVEEWLGYLRYADYVFTNSFHACCFSIIFRKEFFTGIRSGDKIPSLLNLFGLGWRNIADTEEIPAKPIPWGKVDALRRQYKDQSAQFILQAIRETGKVLEDPAYTPVQLQAVEAEAPAGGEEEKSGGLLGRIRQLFSRK